MPLYIDVYFHIMDESAIQAMERIKEIMNQWEPFSREMALELPILLLWQEQSPYRNEGLHREPRCRSRVIKLLEEQQEHA